MKNCKVYGRELSWFIFEALFQHLKGGAEENNEIF